MSSLDRDIGGVSAALTAPVIDGRDISVIVCTRDRVESFRQTLDALRGVRVPDGLTVEAFLVDNNPADIHRAACEAFRWPGVEVRYFHVAEAGLARAQNAALRVARGAVMMFLDDDVRPPVDWLAGVSAPVLSGVADAVGGGVRIPPGVKAAWTTPDHEEWLASTAYWGPDRDPVLVGANMAIGRHVFAAIGGFDEDLAYAIDTVYSHRVKAAGFRVVLRHDIVVDHHVDAFRFTRAGLTRQAALRAECEAFEMHHWSSWHPHLLAIRWLGAKWRLARYRAALRQRLSDENLTLREMRLLQELALWPALMGRRRTPRRPHRLP